MLIDPNAPVSEMTIRAELASRLVQTMNSGHNHIGDFSLEIAVRAADKLIEVLNHADEKTKIA